ncbi:MAG: hypothetical protein AABO41_04070 [Acidobacteriota bacterium]
MRSRYAAAFLSAALLLALVQPAFGQEAARKLPSSKPPAGRAPQKEPHAEPAENAETRQETPLSAEDEMRQTLDRLAAELKSLGSEVQRLRRVTERNGQAMELLLSEERLSRLEDRIQDATERKAQLDAREQDLQRRMRNIPNELLTRGGLRREEAEAAAKAELQRALDDVRNQQSNYQQRIVELNAQAERLRARVETLRKKIDLAEPKSEKE